MEILRRDLYKNRQALTEGSETLKTDGTLYTGQSGTDPYAFQIIDESGKININLLTDSTGMVLNTLLVNHGVPKETADTIVDSILDWKDTDDLHRLHGAESDYYLSLPNPYRSKNGLFHSVEELLMVKGMTPEILYGNDKQSGVFELLTVHAKTGGINVNTARKEVLAALPGMTHETADRIISLRESAEIRSIQDLGTIAGAGLAGFAPYIGFSESGVYTIKATGYKQAEKHGFTIMATVVIEGNDKYRYVYYKSPAR